MNIKYDVILQKLREGDSNPFERSGICTATEEVGEPVYIANNGNFLSASANSISTCKVIGIILSKPTVTTCIIRTGGIISGFTGLSVGQPYFLDVTQGYISEYPPTESGSVIVNVGLAISGTEFLIRLDSNYTIRS